MALDRSQATESARGTVALTPGSVALAFAQDRGGDAVAQLQASAGQRKLTRCVLGRPSEDTGVLYKMGKTLGKGQFGVTYLCVESATGKLYACKTIAKHKLVVEEDVADVRNEVAILEHLAGRPNIGAYEDAKNVHLVMELCAGGELFDRIIARVHYRFHSVAQGVMTVEDRVHAHILLRGSEREAADACRQIMKVVAACHAAGVMHRDLKPENFLLATAADDAPIKAADFGLSTFFKPGEHFSDLCGSAYYIAPEVVRRWYGPEADIWSAGCIAYILLCGSPPFYAGKQQSDQAASPHMQTEYRAIITLRPTRAETEHGIFEAIKVGSFDLDGHPWPSISAPAKDLVRRMLTYDPAKRPSAVEILAHPWIAEPGAAPDVPLDASVALRLRAFAAANRLKKAALRVLASGLTPAEIRQLGDAFHSLDADRSGAITLEELRKGLQAQGSSLAEEEICALMTAADADGSGTIDYEEFLAATMEVSRAHVEEALLATFQHFDADGSGFITGEELQHALGDAGLAQEGAVAEVLAEVDADKDGRIDYEEFVAMFRRTTRAKERSAR
eukprot:SM000020S06095  [mRNA]  locus=s20:1014027:1019676:+ [translate_table: standard]